MTTFAAVLRACGSASHDGSLPPPELMAELAEVHPAVMGTLVSRWAKARDELGGSSAEHPHFRRKVEQALDDYPDGYGGIGDG